MKGLLFTYGMTGLGAVVGLLNPFYGLLVYVCFSIIRPDFMWRWSVPEGNYSRIVAFGMILGWVIRGFGNWNLGRAWGVLALMAGYYAWSAVSNIQGVNPDRGWAFLEFLAKVFIPCLIGITMITNVTQLKQLAWVIVLSQGYVGFELNSYYLGGYNLAYWEGFGGMDNNCLAISMVTCTGLAFFLALGTKSWWLRGLAFLSVLLMLHTILITFSRGGMVAMFVTGFVAFLLLPKRWPHYVGFGVAVLLVASMMGPQVRERLLTVFESKEGQREASAQSRLDLWRDCLDVASRRPVLGVGPEQWGDVAPEYGWKKGKEAHSLWMQNLAEVGVPGTALLAGFFVLVMWRLLRLARGRPVLADPWLNDAARMVICALFGFLVAAQFVTIRYLEVPYYVALLGMGVLRLATPALSPLDASAPKWESAGWLAPAPAPPRRPPAAAS